MAVVVLLYTGTALAAAPTDDEGESPTLELLDYLAEFAVSADGRLIDPLDLPTPPPAQSSQIGGRIGQPPDGEARGPLQ